MKCIDHTQSCFIVCVFFRGVTKTAAATALSRPRARWKLVMDLSAGHARDSKAWPVGGSRG